MSLVDRGFFVIRIDNRDCGLSSLTNDTDEYTLYDMANDLAAVLDDADVAEAVIFGVSLGAMIAQCFAIRHPGRTLALVSMMSSTGEPEFGLGSPEVTEALLAPSASDPAAQVEIDLRSHQLWCNPDWFDEDRLREHFKALHLRAWTPGGGLRQFAAARRTPNRVEELSALDVPTLVVHGENDTLITVSAGRRTAEVITGAKYLEIEGMSHDFVPQVWPPLIEAITALTAETFESRSRNF